MDLDQTICSCFGITVGDIKKAVDKGVTTFDELQEDTGLGTACGMCEEEAKEILSKLLSQKKS